MRRVKQSKQAPNPILFTLSLLTLALNQVVYAEEPAIAQVEKENATELAPIKIRAGKENTEYAVKMLQRQQKLTLQLLTRHFQFK
ncbi:MAG: hypothetical protein ABL859_11890 [Methylotenera sp.]